MTKINVVVISPDNYLHSMALNEVAITFAAGFERLGFETDLTVNEIKTGDAVNFVLGAHLLTETDATLLPPGTVIYNLEQLDDESHWVHEGYKQLLQNFIVWDYSEKNLGFYKKLNMKHPPKICPVGYSPELRRIPSAADQSIDVLFYGSINDRRRVILQGLKDAGLHVVASTSAYGEERDALIAQAKVVLNLHYYSSEIFEIARVFYLLANSKAVVSESAELTGAYSTLSDGFVMVNYDQLVDSCVNLVQNPIMRYELEEQALQAIKQMEHSAILKSVLSSSK